MQEGGDQWDEVEGEGRAEKEKPEDAEDLRGILG